MSAMEEFISKTVEMIQREADADGKTVDWSSLAVKIDEEKGDVEITYKYTEGEV